METTEIDIVGQVCPSSLLLVLREVNQRHDQLSSGELSILVRTDNRDATGTIPAAVQNMGFQTSVDKEQGVYLIRIWQQGSEEQT
ncbi:MAG: sulfurtransferase TusA family protein [Desulfuromonas sp.]|nr:MAG: sulfurtransferase TusA family protein [Desulfuromonas sp.]